MSKNNSKDYDYQKIAYKVSAVSLVGNFLLSLIKLFTGLVFHSAALVSDSVHSASDVLSTFVVIIGVKISSKEADDDHPYGHERFECVTAMLLAGVLALVGLGIGYEGITTIIDGSYHSATTPGILALAVAMVSIVSKEAMYHYTIHYARKINSTALTADAWHHRSDAFSSIGALIGVAGARLGFPICDPIASVVICVFILKAAWDIFKDATNKMVDHACTQEVQTRLRDCAASVKGVECIKDLKTREFGAKIYVELVICVDGKLTLTDAHHIAHQVHDKLESKFPDVKHCMVHVDPA